MGWRVSSRTCDSCKRAAAALFCRADAAFLCFCCDEEIHGANKLASRHERVFLCEVCEQAPAAVTCRADAASLCSACDADIHSANPLASRHHRIPVEPLLDPSSAHGLLKPTKTPPPLPQPPMLEAGSGAADVPSLPVVCGGGIGKPFDEFFNDPCFDFNFESPDELNGPGADGLVPVHAKPEPDLFDVLPEKYLRSVVDLDKSTKFTSFSFSQTVSSSSQDFGVVPDGSDESYHQIGGMSSGLAEAVNSPGKINIQATQLTGLDREARVLRYREKKKNRKFEKTIRYASRKAYAEARPRIKGRFAKRTEVEPQLEDSLFGARPSVFFSDADFGVVPSF
ncbi:hypothetical protein SAY87_018139 [Trapa incisa]|uniref:CONSTANS-like protein n=1 Tax=Trapa incisa TaxID=236973 RepID=A0AAN7LBL0_9MYRT|nr:hypothetical protein SAY87_018139 [Trapa incisa]